MQFLFKDKERPVSLASGLVSGLQVHPPEKLLTADYCFEVFDPQTISELTLLLNPRNVR